MDENKVLYSITVEDVKSISEEIEIDFTENDIEIIQDRIGDFMGSYWSDAIEFALQDLQITRQKK